MLLKLALFFHVIAAMFWIGGMLFLTLVVVPFLQSLPDPAERSRIYQVVGTKYRTYGWAAIITLLATGPLILYTLYGISPGYIFSKGVYGSHFGLTLTIKLALVAVITASSFVHDFYLGPKARTSPNYSRMARIFGRGNLLLALFIVIFAVFLRAGGY